MLDPLDLYGMKRMFARANELGDLLHETADPAFLRRARRALLPIPGLEHPPSVENPLARRPTARPALALEGKKVAVIATGGGGACVSLIGVARGFDGRSYDDHVSLPSTWVVARIAARAT
jgi:hypothetical protein